MIQEAFEYSEAYGTPVFFRPTARVCHGYASIEIKDMDEYTLHKAEGFVKDSNRWVIFPRLSYQNHKKIEARNVALSEEFSTYSRNKIYPAEEQNRTSRKGIAASGISFTYALESLETLGMVRLLKIATSHPFPEKLALEFLDGLDEVLCMEELDSVLERELTYLCGKYHLPVKIQGTVYTRTFQIFSVSILTRQKKRPRKESLILPQLPRFRSAHRFSVPDALTALLSTR